MKRVITSLLAILFVLPMVFPLAACTTETGGENMANYLYNGVELPDINTVWTDKTTYPYAFVMTDGTMTALYLMANPNMFINASGEVAFSASTLVTIYNISDGSWAIAADSLTMPESTLGVSSSLVKWSNHDILNTDGTVYLAASDPVPVGGSKLTISTGGSANGDGMALYNGVMLPNIDSVWSDELKAQYPYAHISVEDNGDLGVLYYLYFTNSVPLYNGSGYKISGNYYNFVCTYDQTIIDAFVSMGVPAFPIGSWADFGAKGAVDGTFGDPVIWTSNDILNTDGTTYLAASDPIPLDGMNVITWDGDTTGLESVGTVDEKIWKISDETPTVDDLINGFLYGYGELLYIKDYIDVTTYAPAIFLANTLLVVPEAGITVSGITLPAGIWSIDDFALTIAYPASSGGSVTDTTATVNFSCKDLLYTDSVYRIQAWVYEPGAGGSGTMLYNGVELPELPEWDKDTYPYAFIEIQKDFIHLYCLKTKFHYCYSGHYACYAMLPYYGDSCAYFYFYRELDSETGTWTDGWKTGSAVDYGTGSYGFPERWSEKLCVWANYDVLNCYHVAEDPECDCPIYLAASDPVPAGGPDVTQPPTFTSELFAGPSHSESHTFTGLTPATEYGIYAVIWSETDGAATEHNATATFTTLEGEEPTGTIQFGAVNITGTGFTAVIEASGLDDATAYTAEIVVYNTATSAVAAEAVRSFTGNYTMAIDFAGLTPETDYTVSVDVYPSDTGKVVARGEFPVTTGVEEPQTSWRDSFLLGFASGLGCTAATKTDADHNAWMQGYLVGDALRSAITTKQGFQYEVPDLQATVRMVAECFTESGDTLLFNAHNGSMILGVSTQNEATFTDRTDVTKYLIPIPAEASKVTVETSDPKVTLAQFVGVNGSGGNYTKVFSSEREAVYSYEFEKGTAQYMAIDLIYEDKGAVTVPWDYVLADTTVTFT